MKFHRFLNIFHKQHKREHADKTETQPQPLNMSTPSHIKKSMSINDIKNNFVDTPKRTTSLRKSSSTTSLRSKPPHLKLNYKPTLDSLRKVKPFIDLTQSTLFTPVDESNTTKNITDESYTTLFNSLYNNYNQVDSDSCQSSFLSNKEIKQPPSYFLSQSKLPNYELSTYKSPCVNPFSEFENYNNLPHEKLLLRASQIHGLSPSDSLSDAIRKHRNSLYLDSEPSNDIDDDVFNFIDSYPLLSSPKTDIKPQCSLPLLPKLISPIPLNPYRAFFESTLDDSNTNNQETDIDNKSLFDALSNVEWCDCSKITLSSYNT